MKVERAILIFFFVCIIIFLITLKISGATENPIIIEKIGYCKIIYGDEFHLKEGEGFCYDPANYEEKFYFNYDEFREVCPKHEFLSLSFFSDCFYKGGSLNYN